MVINTRKSAVKAVFRGFFGTKPIKEGFSANLQNVKCHFLIQRNHLTDGGGHTIIRLTNQMRIDRGMIAAVCNQDGNL